MCLPGSHACSEFAAPDLHIADPDAAISLCTGLSHMETCRPRPAQVTALRFSRNGALLASGSKDTDIVVWDVAGEAGLYRLRGHRDQVRCAALAK